MNESPEHDHQVSFWPSVSDLFMTLFIVIVALLGAVFYILIPKHNPGPDRAVVQACGGTEMKRIKAPVNRMREAMGAEQLRATLDPGQVVDALDETSEQVVNHLQKIPGFAQLQREKSKLQAEIDRMKQLLDSAEKEQQRLQKEIKDLVASKGVPPDQYARVVKDLEQAQKELNDKPPIIRINEGEAYRFPSGSAKMSQEFVNALQEKEFLTLADEIRRRNNEEQLKVDTIEIIGHTDGQPIVASGNLDSALPGFLSGKTGDISALRPGSNNDLGLLRALAVRRAWQQFIGGANADPALAKVAVRCYSAGQTLPEDVSLTIPDSFQMKEERFRRIEMRLTQLARTPPPPPASPSEPVPPSQL